MHLFMSDSEKFRKIAARLDCFSESITLRNSDVLNIRARQMVREHCDYVVDHGFASILKAPSFALEYRACIYISQRGQSANNTLHFGIKTARANEYQIDLA